MKLHTPAAGRALFLGSGVAALAALAAFASPGTATTELRACTNGAWAEYNSCLMETDSWWVRKGCDISFQAEYVRCWAAYRDDIL